MEDVSEERQRRADPIAPVNATPCSLYRDAAGRASVRMQRLHMAGVYTAGGGGCGGCSGVAAETGLSDLVWTGRGTPAAVVKCGRRSASALIAE